MHRQTPGCWQREGGSCCGQTSGGISTPKPAPPCPLQLEGIGTSPPNPAGRSAERRAGSPHGQDYKSHNAPDRGGGEGGAGVFRCLRPRRSRPEVPDGPLWSWCSRAVSPRAAPRRPASPPPRALAVTRSAHPAAARALLRPGAGGGGRGRVGDGAGQVADPELDLGSTGRWFGEAPRGGAQSCRRRVGPRRAGVAPSQAPERQGGV